jgi:hypothetical protein
LVDHLLASEEVGQLYDVVDVVAILDVVGFVDHPHVVEDVVLPDHELKQDDSHRPYVRLVRLLGVVQDRFEGHVRLGSDLVATNDAKTIRQTFVNLQVLL